MNPMKLQFSSENISTYSFEEYYLSKEEAYTILPGEERLEEKLNPETGKTGVGSIYSTQHKTGCLV